MTLYKGNDGLLYQEEEGGQYWKIEKSELKQRKEFLQTSSSFFINAFMVYQKQGQLYQKLKTMKGNLKLRITDMSELAQSNTLNFRGLFLEFLQSDYLNNILVCNKKIKKNEKLYERISSYLALELGKPSPFVGFVSDLSITRQIVGERKMQQDEKKRQEEEEMSKQLELEVEEIQNDEEKFWLKLTDTDEQGFEFL